MQNNYTKRIRNIWFIVGSFLSGLFIFALPWIYQYQNQYYEKDWYINNGTSCQDNCIETKAQTISGFISSAPATGFMAMIFFTPIMAMWSIPEPKVCFVDNVDLHNQVKITPGMKWASVICLIAFQLSFGLFLAFPNTYNSALHGIVVVAFAVSGMAYSIFQIIFLREHINKCANKPKHSYKCCQFPLFFLYAGIIGLVSVVFALVTDKFTYGFWFVECVALSAMSMFTPAYLQEFRHKNEMQPLYYEMGLKQINVWRVIFSILPTIYIFPGLSLISGTDWKYVAQGSSDNLSIFDYLRGELVTGQDELLQGGAVGALLALMYIPLLIIWNVYPNDNPLQPQDNPQNDEHWFRTGWNCLFYVWQILFTLMFFINFSFPIIRESIADEWVNIVMISITMIYYFVRLLVKIRKIGRKRDFWKNVGVLWLYCVVMILVIGIQITVIHSMDYFVWIAFITAIFIFSMLTLLQRFHLKLEFPHVLLFVWNFISSVYLLIMKYCILSQDHQYGISLFVFEVSFFWSIIWTIPLEMIFKNYLKPGDEPYENRAKSHSRQNLEQQVIDLQNRLISSKVESNILEKDLLDEREKSQLQLEESQESQVQEEDQ